MSINRILADLGKAVDSSSTGNFLNKEASGAEFNPVQWSDINSAPTILDSALASAIIDSAYVQARQTGVGSGGLDSATTIALIDSDYVGARASTGGSGFTKYQYTATASQTTFQDSDANGNVLSYDADYILVHYNGVLLPSADYTATDGSSVVLGTGADSGSIIAIAKWGAAAGSSSGGYSAALFGDRGINAGGQTSGASATISNISYFDITTPGNASDFGDLTTTKMSVAAATDATRAVFEGGYSRETTTYLTDMDYVTVATAANASDFGDTTISVNSATGLWDATYGIFAGGVSTTGASGGRTNEIRYVTIQTTGNASDFGDLTNARNGGGGANDATRGIICAGYNGSTGAVDVMDYITMATQGNATDFGDYNRNMYDMCGVSDGTYAVWGGGDGLITIAEGGNGGAGPHDRMDYVTIQTLGNSTQFGDLTTAREKQGTTGSSNGTYGVFMCGSNDGGAPSVANNINTMDYITIATTGNATDFGDNVVAAQYVTGTSGNAS